jgi:LysM repeat protein
MAEEPEVSLPTEEPRKCPACGSRVAAMASTCLMCGASLEEEEATPQEEEPRKGLPGWARVIIVVVLAAAILVTGSYGLMTLMNAEPEEVTPTATPTRTPTATPTPTPTRTPTVTPTPTPLPPLTYQVQEGDTLSLIAAAYDTTVEVILALNPGIAPESLPVGYVLLIPAGTLTPTPTPTLDPNMPTPTPGEFIIHIVAPGETLGTIAEEYGVSLALLREINELPPGDDTIFPNQSLVIPIGTPMPSLTPTVDLNATPTPVPPYPAPPLLSPPDGAVLAGSEQPVLLQWASVGVLHDDEEHVEWYEVTLSQPAGDAILETVYTRATAWRVPFDLLLTADAGAADVREFHWRVQVVREARDWDGTLVYVAAGDVSPVRTFTWIAPTATPTPTLTPSPTPVS